MDKRNLKSDQDIITLLDTLAQREALPPKSLTPRIMQAISENAKEAKSLSARGICDLVQNFLQGPLLRYATLASLCLVLAVSSMTMLGSEVNQTFSADIVEHASVESVSVDSSRLLDVLESNFGKRSYLPSGFTALSLTLLASFLLSKRRYVLGVISAALASLFLLVPLMLSQF